MPQVRNYDRPTNLLAYSQENSQSNSGRKQASTLNLLKLKLILKLTYLAHQQIYLRKEASEYLADYELFVIIIIKITIIAIIIMIATIREEASEYLADYELCVQRVKLQLKRDLAAQPENNGRSALISDMRDLFILIKKSSF